MAVGGVVQSGNDARGGCFHGLVLVLVERWDIIIVIYVSIELLISSLIWRKDKVLNGSMQG